MKTLDKGFIDKIKTFMDDNEFLGFSFDKSVGILEFNNYKKTFDLFEFSSDLKTSDTWEGLEDELCEFFGINPYDKHRHEN